MGLRPFQGAAHLLPNGSGDGLQQPRDPEWNKVGVENGWMDIKCRELWGRERRGESEPSSFIFIQEMLLKTETVFRIVVLGLNVLPKQLIKQSFPYSFTAATYMLFSSSLCLYSSWDHVHFWKGRGSHHVHVGPQRAAEHPSWPVSCGLQLSAEGRHPGEGGEHPWARRLSAAAHCKSSTGQNTHAFNVEMIFLHLDVDLNV